MRLVQLVLAAAFTVVTVPAGASAPPARPSQSCERLFGVVFKVTLDPQDRIERIDVEYVVDPNSGSTPEEAARRPIQMDLPSSYLAAARRFLEGRSYRGVRSPFWTYTVYDPTQPDSANPCG